jgi:TPR repeat protein
MRLLELKDNSGYVAMAELENSILSNGVVNKTLSKAEQKIQLDIVLKWYEKGTAVGDERSFIVLVIYALGLQVYNEDIYYKMINSKDDRWQLDWQYDIIKPVKPWKKLKNLEHAYALAKKAESFGLIKPIKIVSNYSQFYDNKIRNNFYNKAVKLHELKLYNAEYISLLTMAAEKYYVAAINDLGVAYFRGSSVSKQDIIAYKYFKLGAELGNETAMENLSMMYARGVLKDDRKSFYIKPDYKRTKYWKEQAEKAKSESKW